jgi:KipI family sensor histidine kinase inhibitor
MIGAVIPRLLAAGDTGLLVELGDDVSEVSSRAVAELDARLAARPPAGVVEVSPALRSLLVEYDPTRTSQARLRGDVMALLDSCDVDGAPLADAKAREHVLDVVYDGADLVDVARAGGVDAAEVARLHSAATYRVAMLGNLPGLPYLLGLDARLRVPRRDDPRDAVPLGAVAVANALSCIYPAPGPGGWNLIGRTNAVLFDAHRQPPALLAPGDTVRFVARDALPRDAAAHGMTSSAHRDPPAASLRVVEPGLLTTVQDRGRRGLQRIGVPVCGALDREWLQVANLLAGNAPDDAALEVTHTGPLLEVHAHSTRIAVAGDAELTRISADGTRARIESWRSVTLRDGERLHVGRVHGALRCIVAVEGGVDVEPVLGSRSTCLRSQFGGLDGRALQRGDVLPLRREYAGHHPDMHLTPDTLHDAQLTPRRNATTVRAVLGPQDDACTTGSIEALLHTALTVSHRSDRSGLRLDGIRMRHRGAAEVISDGCAAGSVQVPGGGTPIVLLADRGTTGGYPKVATIASVDMPRLGRLRPGDTLHLDAIDVAGAERLRRDRERILAALPDMLEPVAVG